VLGAKVLHVERLLPGCTEFPKSQNSYRTEPGMINQQPAVW
jgi:hypothetical protein